MIKAEGVKNKKKMTVIYNGDFLFNGKKNEVLQRVVEFELKQFHAIGGTYYAEKETDTLNILSVLQNHFFDYPTVDIITDEDVSIPFEKGVVY